MEQAGEKIRPWKRVQGQVWGTGKESRHRSVNGFLEATRIFVFIFTVCKELLNIRNFLISDCYIFIPFSDLVELYLRYSV